MSSEELPYDETEADRPGMIRSQDPSGRDKHRGLCGDIGLPPWVLDVAPGWCGSILGTLACLWRSPGLLDHVRILPSSRMIHALARAFPATGLIRINKRVLEFGSEEQIREILTHEAAHIACWLIHHRRKLRPHGPEWRELMQRAGFEPRVRMDAHALPSLCDAPARQRPLRYEHHCPVCGWSRRAKTTNRRWRCADCVRAGRKGRLVATRLNNSAADTPEARQQAARAPNS